MKTFLFWAILIILLGNQNLMGQCDFITPPSVKKIKYADREFTFSNVTINGNQTTYLAVKKGQKVKITTNVESRKSGNYCPDCIVQVYWGIRGHASEGAKSFHGYQFNRKKSTLKFDAPLKDGIYYITMGAVLDYSIKNNIYRPNCSANDAFAVLKVGTPDPDKKIELVKTKQGKNEFLKATLVKAGCFVNLDKIEWFLNDKKLAYDDRVEIPLTETGTYKVIWSNCLANATQTYEYGGENGEKVINLSINEQRNVKDNSENTKKISLSVKTNPKTNEEKKDLNSNNTNSEGSNTPENIDSQIENSDKFVMKNLIFDLGEYEVKQEAKKDLIRLAQIMKENPTMKILLEGHTDVRGGARKNRELSLKRVESAKAYLVEQGVEESNIDIIGWGHQKPLVKTKDVEIGKINRRVEVQILSR